MIHSTLEKTGLPRTGFSFDSGSPKFRSGWFMGTEIRCASARYSSGRVCEEIEIANRAKMTCDGNWLLQIIWRLMGGDRNSYSAKDIVGASAYRAGAFF